MKQVNLIPNNRRIKQLIKQYGELWNVVRLEDYVECFKGPGIFIASECGDHYRWIRPASMQGNIVQFQILKEEML